MKKMHFIHALVITPFEKAILGQNANNWLYIANQDYCVHALYSVEQKKILFLGTNLITDTESQINHFLEGFISLHPNTEVTSKIVTLAFGEDELNEQIVANHLR